MRKAVAKKVLEFLTVRTICRRPADVIIGGSDDPYMHRWWVIPRNSVFNVYLHFFMRSDDDRALHDHPWWNFSFLLDGTYVEHTISAGGVNHKRQFYAGDFKLRGARYAHRVELVDGPCWSLFITGPKIRRWGFHCPNGWKHWKEYTLPGRPGEIGRGCE